MTRAEILKKYKVEGETIVSPGNFEGFPLWAPYFWQKCWEGGGDGELEDEGNFVTIFDICRDDLKQFPELWGYAQVHVYEDDAGFVRIYSLKKEELE